MATKRAHGYTLAQVEKITKTEEGTRTKAYALMSDGAVLSSLTFEWDAVPAWGRKRTNFGWKLTAREAKGFPKGADFKTQRLYADQWVQRYEEAGFTQVMNPR